MLVGRLVARTGRLNRPVRGIEAGEIIIENEVREGDGHGDIDSLDEMEAADRQEENLPWIEQEIKDLRLAESGVSRGRRDTAVDSRKAVKIIAHQRQVPRRRELDALAADHLRHEIVGQVVMERRDRAGGPIQKKPPGGFAVRYSGT